MPYSFTAFSFSPRLCWFTVLISHKLTSPVLKCIWVNFTSWCKSWAIIYSCGLPNICNSSWRIHNKVACYSSGKTTINGNPFLKGHNCLLSWTTPPQKINCNCPWNTTFVLIYLNCILLSMKQPLINTNLTMYAGTQYAVFAYTQFFLGLHVTFPQQFFSMFSIWEVSIASFTTKKLKTNFPYKCWRGPLNSKAQLFFFFFF